MSIILNEYIKTDYDNEYLSLLTSKEGIEEQIALGLAAATKRTPTQFDRGNPPTFKSSLKQSQCNFPARPFRPPVFP